MNDDTTLQAWAPGEPWRRILASVLDLVLVIPFGYATGIATDIALQWQNPAPLAAASCLWWTLNLFLIVRFQGTPGKRLMGLRIFRMDGRRPGWMDAINRQILYIGLSFIYILHQGALLPNVPPGTDVEAFMKLVPQSPSSWEWAIDASLALLWASCLLILMRPDRRALYDLWSGTVVVRSVSTKPVLVA